MRPFLRYRLSETAFSLVSREFSSGRCRSLGNGKPKHYCTRTIQLLILLCAIIVLATRWLNINYIPRGMDEEDATAAVGQSSSFLNFFFLLDR